MPGRFQRFLPFLGPAIGLLGITLAIYFRFQSITEREPTYYVHPARARIVDITGRPTPSELEVLYKGKPVGKRNVTAARVYFWNEGRMPITKADVLEPLFLEFSPSSTEILEARMLKATRGVIKFAIEAVEERTARNRVRISFDVLEKSDGAAMQIIYVGDPNASISLKGTIVGVPGLKPFPASRIESHYARPTPKQSFNTKRRLALIFVGLGGVAMASAIFLRWLVGRRPSSQEGADRRRKWLLLGILTFILYSSIGAYQLYDAYRTISPGVPASIWLEE